MLYQGKRILITGATSGLGKFMALKYAKHGGTIIGIGRDKVKINSLESELKAINNNNHIIKSIDVSSNLLMNQFAVELGRKIIFQMLLLQMPLVILFVQLKN